MTRRLLLALALVPLVALLVPAPAGAWDAGYCGHGSRWVQGTTVVYRSGVSMRVDGRWRHWHSLDHHEPGRPPYFWRGRSHRDVKECPYHL